MVVNCGEQIHLFATNNRFLKLGDVYVDPSLIHGFRIRDRSVSVMVDHIDHKGPNVHSVLQLTGKDADDFLGMFTTPFLGDQNRVFPVNHHEEDAPRSPSPGPGPIAGRYALVPVEGIPGMKGPAPGRATVEFLTLRDGEFHHTGELGEVVNLSRHMVQGSATVVVMPVGGNLTVLFESIP